MALQLAILAGVDAVGATSNPEQLKRFGITQVVDREATDAGDFDAILVASGARVSMHS